MSDKWAAISKEVAVALWGAPNARLSRGDRWRWGNKGSKSLDADKGLWKDFEADTGGGVLELVEIECQTDRRGAIQWLKDNGYWIESSPRHNVGRLQRQSARPVRQRTTRQNRQRAAHKPKSEPKESGTQNFARKLWRESKSIPAFDSQHPFWRWATTGDKPSVLHPYCTVPGGIRWHSGRSLIICGVFPLVAWGKGDQPKGDPVAVQALAIDQDGQKRYALTETKDRDKCNYGPKSAGVFILGDPKSERVNIVEGLADALAVYSREPGAVLATLGTSKTLPKKFDVIDWLITKETWLYPDNDENKAGDEGAAALTHCIKSKSPDAVVRKPATRAFGDPGKWAEQTPFLEGIERYDFEEKKGILFDSGLSWGEADRMAIQTLMGRESNEQ